MSAQESPVFEWVSGALERKTSFHRLQARGIVRWTLRKVGISPDQVTRSQMQELLADILLGQLERSGVVDPQRLCAELAEELETAELTVAQEPIDEPEDIFQRMFRMESPRKS